jgi:hypothetical protein
MKTGEALQAADLTGEDHYTSCDVEYNIKKES